MVDVYGDAAVVQITTLGISGPAQRDLRRARGGARQQDDLRDLARLLRRAGGVRRRLARRARRAAHERRRCWRTASRWRSSRSPDRRPGCSSTSARRAPASARCRAARACSISTPTPAASRWPPREAAPRRSPPSTARPAPSPARWRTPPRTASRSKPSRPTPFASSRPPRRASFDLLVVDPPKFARARKDLEAARKGYERLNALALQAAAPGAILVTCSCSQNVDAESVRTDRRRRRQAGRPRGPRLRAPRPRRRPPPAARLHRGPVPQSPPLLRGLTASPAPLRPQTGPGTPRSGAKVERARGGGRVPPRPELSRPHLSLRPTIPSFQLRGRGGTRPPPPPVEPSGVEPKAVLRRAVDAAGEPCRTAR